MKLQFVDINNPPRPSTVFNNCEELREALDNLRNSGALMFELWGNNGYKLGIGLDSAIGCVQFSGIDHDPPYFMALANSPVSQESHRSTKQALLAVDNSLPNSLLFPRNGRKKSGS
jgi:hypothetical protein